MLINSILFWRHWPLARFASFNNVQLNGINIRVEKVKAIRWNTSELVAAAANYITACIKLFMNNNKMYNTHLKDLKIHALSSWRSINWSLFKSMRLMSISRRLLDSSGVSVSNSWASLTLPAKKEINKNQNMNKIKLNNAWRIFISRNFFEKLHVSKQIDKQLRQKK